MERIAWTQVIEELKRNTTVAPMMIDAFFSSAVFQCISAEEAVITCENKVSKHVLEDHIQYIQQAIDTLFHIQPVCTIEVKGDNSTTVREYEQQPIFHEHLPNRNFRIDSFITGDSNRTCTEELLKRLYHPEESFEPLLIQGASGTGKSHLLHAAGNYFIEKYESKKVLCFHAAELMRMIVDNAKRKEKLIEELSSVDVLLIDDIHLLVTRQFTCEVLTAALSKLINEKKLIIVTATNLQENDESYLENVLKSFKIVFLPSIDLFTAKTITQLKIDREIGLAVEFDDKAIEYIALNYASNAHQLDACIQKILFWSIQSFEENIIDLKTVKAILEEKE